MPSGRTHHETSQSSCRTGSSCPTAGRRRRTNADLSVAPNTLPVSRCRLRISGSWFREPEERGKIVTWLTFLKKILSLLKKIDLRAQTAFAHPNKPARTARTKRKKTRHGYVKQERRKNSKQIENQSTNQWNHNQSIHPSINQSTLESINQADQ